MTLRYGSTFTGTFADGTKPPASVDGAKNGATRHVIREVFDMAAQTIVNGDTLFLGRLPTGALFDGVELVTSASLGSSTVAVGTSGSAAKYKAAAVFTATDTPTRYGKASAFAQAALSAPEDVIATIAAADMPTSGTLVFELAYLIVG